MRRLIHSFAPVRIADNGGWTDTWFARHGSVLNIAVTPGVDVSIEVFARNAPGAPVTLHLADVSYAYEPRAGRRGKNPLIEAAIDFMGIPEDLAVRIAITSAVPPGASTGTSASVTVSLLAALARLHEHHLEPMALAMAAHHVEMDILGWQCGVQDQIAAAFGGINFIAIGPFPTARVEPLNLPAELLRQLETRLLLVYLGSSHQSSDIHRIVIAELEAEGEHSPRLEVLRSCAGEARAALLAGDLEAFGRSLAANTDAQLELHPALLSEAARTVIDIAVRYGAAGWKVNGAGGDGGSVSILQAPGCAGQQEMLAEIAGAIPASWAIPIRLSPTGATSVSLD